MSISYQEISWLCRFYKASFYADYLDFPHFLFLFNIFYHIIHFIFYYFALFSHFIFQKHKRNFSWKAQILLKTHSISNKKFVVSCSIVKHTNTISSDGALINPRAFSFHYAKSILVFPLYSSPAFKTTLGNCGTCLSHLENAVFPDKTIRSW